MKLDIYLYIWQLATIPTYNGTLPTGQVLGKFWKTKVKDGWLLGTYYSCSYDEVYIAWLNVHILEGPKPFKWIPPDWNNYKGWVERWMEDKVI